MFKSLTALLSVCFIFFISFSTIASDVENSKEVNIDLNSKIEKVEKSNSKLKVSKKEKSEEKSMVL